MSPGYWLAGLLFLIGVGLAGFAVLTFATAPFPPWANGGGSISLGAMAAGAVFLFRGRPGDLDIARPLDRDLNSRERIQTLVQEQGREGRVLALLRQEAGAYFRANAPKYKVDRRRFRRPAMLVLASTLLLVAAIILTPGLARSFDRLREFQELREQAAETIEEILQELPQEEPLLGISPGNCGSWPSRPWRPEPRGTGSPGPGGPGTPGRQGPGARIPGRCPGGAGGPYPGHVPPGAGPGRC